MDEFPFTSEDWFRVSEAARAVLNATFAEDEVLQAFHFEELCYLLAELREKYGQHPVLLETEADFTHAPLERIALYEQGRENALAGGLFTYSIRISLARVLLEERGDVQGALRELTACRDEVRDCGETREQEEWEELERACTRLKEKR